MSWNMMKPRKFVGAPPPVEATPSLLDRPIGKGDGRSARATGRRAQFNPRVHPNFIDAFKAALKEEE